MFFSIFQAVHRCVAAAGFSVGEITALVFAGAIQFEDGNIHQLCFKVSIQHFSLMRVTHWPTFYF